MSTSRVRLVVLAWLIALLVNAFASWAVLTDPRGLTDWEQVVLFVGLGFGFATVGTILVIRRPREAVGRIALLIGFVAIAASGLRSISIALDGLPGPMPTVGALVAVISTVLLRLIFLSGGLLLVRFPAGRERDRLSALADALFLVAIGCSMVVMIAPGEVNFTGIAAVQNPLGIEAFGRDAAQAIANLGLFSYLAGLAVAAAVLVRRYRRSGSVVRAQIRWVAAAGALPVVLFPGLFVGPEWLWSVWVLSFALLPLSIGIAILRYRLYDIDQIVSRTVAYALVTGLMAAVFLATNLVLQGLVVGVTGGGTLTIAASTLAVAALFQPVRRALQAPIDRRFNRAHVDARHLVDSFAERARDEVDLERLAVEMLRVAAGAVQPTGVRLWLRHERTR